LVLIVVAAAAAFSIFVASYEAQLTAAQKAAHTRALEDIRILSVSTVSNGAEYTILSFVAGSLDINNMIVNELSINGEYINYFTVTPLGSASTVDVCALCASGSGTVQEFNLSSLEQVTITVSLTLWNSVSNPTGGFLNPYTIATSGPTNYIAIGVYTTLGNDFTRTFSAPTAVALTEQSEIYTGSTYEPVVVFDGSQSIVPANDSIVSWSWSISYANVPCFELSGEKVLLPQNEIPYGTYTAVLTVDDSNGLVGTASIPYLSTVTSPVITACLSQGPTGSSSSLVGSGFTPSVAGGVSVTFGGPALTLTSCSDGSALGVTPGTITPSAIGTIDCAFTVPSSGPGDETIQATDSTSHANPTTTFVVTTPFLALSPTSGASGTIVSASGAGFTPDVTISFSITPTSPTGGAILPTSPCTASWTGTFSVCTFSISGTSGDAYMVMAEGSDGTFDAATAQFAVN
jgi:hypothetical protein